MFKDPKRITIFTGNLGSGKTEVAVNYALYLTKEGKQTAVVDLDIVNPYFRTRLIRDSLTEKGLRVVCPRGELASADVPALSPAIRGVFDNEEIQGVFDVGGDDVGATALGRFKPFLPPGSHNLYFVVNACRPFTRDKAGITKMLRSIEKASRLSVTGLISNTNLGRETDLQTILEGHKVVEDTARELNLPVAFMAVRSGLGAELRSHIGTELPVLELELFMQPPWLQAEQNILCDPLLKIPQGPSYIETINNTRG